MGLDRTILSLVCVDRTSTSFVFFEDEDPEEAIFLETVVLHVGVDRTVLSLVVVDRTSACFVFEDEDPEEAIFPLENSVVYNCIEDHC